MGNLVVWYHSHSSSLILSINFLRMHCVLPFRTLINTKPSVAFSIIPPPKYFWPFSTAWPLNLSLQHFQFGNWITIFCSPHCPPIKVLFPIGNRIFWEFVWKALLYLRYRSSTVVLLFTNPVISL